MKPTVSIIIPVYRAADSVTRCVESLINGTYRNLEILLIEDCSPDDSWAVCRQLEETYPCVRAFRNETNSGPSVTRNRGLEEMTGEYLMFVDSDDWVEPDFVESFMSIHAEQKPDMIVCGYWNHDETQNATTDIFVPEEAGEAQLRATLLPLQQKRLLQMIWNKLFKVSIIREHNISFDPKIRIGEDFRFLLTYLENLSGDRLVLINRPLYHYIRCNGASLMFQFGSENPDELLADLNRMYILMGTDDTQRLKMLEHDRKIRKQVSAYLIMHNMGMPLKERRKRILNLDKNEGKALYRRNLVLYYKERVAVLFKRITRR